MSAVTFQGNPVAVSGQFPQAGQAAPDFILTGADLTDIRLADFKGQKLLLNIFPSIDTGVCATSVRKFNEKAATLANTKVLCVSMDLPFAASRFCAAEGIENVQVASAFRHPEFLKAYGVALSDGALRGLSARAVVCIDEQGQVVHAERVAELTEEPGYEAAIAALS
ncbi:lipid hydroperoxide peroxidase [Zobellella denitrificans]|jgi:thioredoxin-dependent peroxiredoxin|uniref:Thiol peroxidase n=1 Tax=Zobellella denitrificans TaxID=347534 RepID=A0A231MVJ4_9GAMM|nr:thiol peroxidase [Zobellella denitrificans]ATG73095.1 peroxidase [Zobellella denitrificans]OXS14243.1 lipid hydroperoxide peroxidase [Zobellella denitrificans]